MRIPAKDDKPNEVQYFQTLKKGLSLVLYVSYGGTKRWRVLFYDNGKPRTKSLKGTYPKMSVAKATEAAFKFHPEQAVASAKAGTFREVAENWIADHVDKKRLRTSYEIKRQLKKYVFPEWENWPIFEIDRSDVNNLLRTIEKNHGAPMADYVLATIRSIMTWYTVEDRHYTPAVVPKMKRDLRESQERARKRILDDDEIRAVWEASNEMGTYGALVKVLLLTGQRSGCLRSMRWRDIADDGVWTIPEQHREKGHIGCVKLPDSALKIINKQPRIVGNEHVFPAAKGKGPINSFSRSKLELDKALPKRMPEWRLHDLRRTARSLMARAGVADHIAERTIGHKLQGVVAIYNRHPYLEEKSEALERLAKQIMLILNPPEGTNVVPLRQSQPEVRA